MPFIERLSSFSRLCSVSISTETWNILQILKSLVLCFYSRSLYQNDTPNEYKYQLWIKNNHKLWDFCDQDATTTEKRTLRCDPYFLQCIGKFPMLWREDKCSVGGWVPAGVSEDCGGKDKLGNDQNGAILLEKRQTDVSLKFSAQFLLKVFAKS